MQSLLVACREACLPTEVTDMQDMEISEVETDQEAGPLVKFRAGSIVAYVWTNEIETRDGPVEVKSIQLERLFKDSCDEWRTSSFFRTQDLPTLAALLQRVYEVLVVATE
jgi:hypothetical protein